MKTLGAVLVAVVLSFGAGHALSPHADSPTYLFPVVPQNMLDSTVLIRTQVNDNQYAGSGVAIDGTHILTAAHLFSDNDENTPGEHLAISVEVRKRAGKSEGRIWTSAKLIRVDPELDAALIELEEGCLDATASIDFMATTPVGYPVFIVGAPAGVSATTATLGYVADRGRAEKLKDSHYWMASNASFSGNSGGPVFDANTGKLIGILQAGVRGCPNVSLFLPVSLLRGWF